MGIFSSSETLKFSPYLVLGHEGLNFNSNFSPVSHAGKQRRTLRTWAAVKRRGGCRFFNVIYTLRSSLVRPSRHAHVVWLFVLVPVGDCTGRLHRGSLSASVDRLLPPSRMDPGFFSLGHCWRAALRKHRLSRCDVSGLNGGGPQDGVGLT